jgi:hypothetical protein
MMPACRTFLFTVFYGLSSFAVIFAQVKYFERLKNLHMEGSADAGSPVYLTDSCPVTVSFDIDEDYPPDLHIKILLSDMNWNVLRSMFSGISL